MPKNNAGREDAAGGERLSWVVYVLLAVLVGLYLGVNQMIDNTATSPAGSPSSGR
jgi:hypothetical protein